MYIATYGGETYEQNVSEQRAKNAMLDSITDRVKRVFVKDGKTYRFFSFDKRKIHQGALDDIIRTTIIAASNNEEVDILSYDTPSEQYVLASVIIQRTRPAINQYFLGQEIAHDVKNRFKEEGLLAGGNTRLGKYQRNLIQQKLVPAILRCGQFDLNALHQQGQFPAFSQAVADTTLHARGVKEALADNRLNDVVFADVVKSLKTQWGQYSEDLDPHSTVKEVEKGIAHLVKNVLRDKGVLDHGRMPGGRKQRITIQKLVVPALLEAGNFDVMKIGEESKSLEFIDAIADVLASDEGKALIKRGRALTENETGRLLAALPERWNAYKQERPDRQPAPHVSTANDQGSLRAPLLQHGV